MPAAQDRKISQEKALTTPADADRFLVSDTSAATGGQAKDVAGSNLLKYFWGFLKIVLGNLENVTLSGNTATITQGYVRLAPEGGVPDNLDTISGGSQYDILLLRRTTDDITVRHGIDNIFLDGAADKALDSNRDMLVLFNYDGSNWAQLMFSNNA